MNISIPLSGYDRCRACGRAFGSDEPYTVVIVAGSAWRGGMARLEGRAELFRCFALCEQDKDWTTPMAEPPDGEEASAIHRSGIIDGVRVYETPLRRLPPDATDLEYLISSYQVWRPGVYDSERAARYAFRFSDADLQALQDSMDPGGVIAFEMLQALRRRGR